MTKKQAIDSTIARVIKASGLSLNGPTPLPRAMVRAGVEQAFELGKIAGLREMASAMNHMPCPPEWGEIRRWEVWGDVAEHVKRRISYRANMLAKKARATK